MALLCVCGAAGAMEFLPDPTRPAVDLSPEKKNGGVGGMGGGGTANEAAPVVIKEVLQSVIISPQYRAAVISGETVMLGDKFKGATLVDVLESSVVLNDAQGKRVLQLYPGVRLNKIEPVVAPIVIEQSAPVEKKVVAKKVAAKKVGKKYKAPEKKDAEKNMDEGEEK
ncbi:MAG: hypothetical protein Q8O24_10190 [Gallionellaceae bacterium]|nr:hypothetical protein [Gallionellaceae bacterium]